MVQMEEQPEPSQKACGSRASAKQAPPPGLRELCPREGEGATSQRVGATATATGDVTASELKVAVEGDLPAGRKDE